MAYMTKNGKGPYPNKAGEYCGNHMKGSQAYAWGGQTRADAQYIQENWLAKMRFGRPRPTEASTTEDLEAMGYVGLYLKEDEPWPLGDDEIDIPTPPELLEPSD